MTATQWIELLRAYAGVKGQGKHADAYALGSLSAIMETVEKYLTDDGKILLAGFLDGMTSEILKSQPNPPPGQAG